MVSKPLARRKSSISPGRERSKSSSPPPPNRASSVSSKPSVTQFQSKGARNEMELHFDRYCSLERSLQTEGITGRGLAQLFSEIAVPPSSLDCFAVLWKLGATQKGCVTRSEWIMAMYAHGIESLSQLKLKAAEWAKDVRSNDGSFLLMYNFVYDYVRGEGDRCMSLANATKAWDVLLEKKKRYPQWKLWAADHIKSDVTRDLWRQVGVLLTLSPESKPNGSEMGSSAALPTVISSFLEQSGKAA